MLNQLLLSKIDAVAFYKRDEIMTDLICCDVEIHGRVWTFHEEAGGWQALIAHLSALPGFRSDWHEAVVGPLSPQARQSHSSGDGRPMPDTIKP